LLGAALTAGCNDKRAVVVVRIARNMAVTMLGTGEGSSCLTPGKNRDKAKWILKINLSEFQAPSRVYQTLPHADNPKLSLWGNLVSGFNSFKITLLNPMVRQNASCSNNIVPPRRT
jgi:hypothetical protein